MINYFETTFNNETVHMAEQNRTNFNTFVALLNREIKARGLDAYATLNTIYEDCGARLVWNTVIVNYTTSRGRQSSYQALCPRDWEIINKWESLEVIGNILNELMDGKYGIASCFCKD